MAAKKTRTEAETVTLLNPLGIAVTVSAEKADAYLAKGYIKAPAKSAASSKTEK